MDNITLTVDTFLTGDPYNHTNPLLAERGKDYGDFRENWVRIAELWSAYTGHKISPHDAVQMMVLLKISRSKANPRKQDNYDDAKGYTDLAELLKEYTS